MYARRYSILSDADGKGDWGTSPAKEISHA